MNGFSLRRDETKLFFSDIIIKKNYSFQVEKSHIYNEKNLTTKQHFLAQVLVLSHQELQYCCSCSLGAAEVPTIHLHSTVLLLRQPLELKDL